MTTEFRITISLGDDSQFTVRELFKLLADQEEILKSGSGYLSVTEVDSNGERKGDTWQRI